MDIEQLQQKILHIDSLVTALYNHIIPGWKRTLGARALANTMAKKNHKGAKSTTHHKLAGELIMSSRISKKWRPKKRVPLVPMNTPERMTKESWKKLRGDVKHSIVSFHQKLLKVERKRVTEQLENLMI